MNVRVLQWNIDYSEPIAAVVNFVAAQSADVICLQELTENWQPNHPDTAAYVAQQLGYEHVAAYGDMVLPTGELARMGVGIFSRWPIVDVSKICIQERIPGPDGQLQGDERYLLECMLDINGRELRVATVHLPFNPHFRTTPAKQAMVEKIIARLPRPHNDASTDDALYILAADLNSVPRSLAARLLRANLQNAGPALAQPTWTTKPFGIGPFKYDTLQWRLDYILHSVALRCVSAERLQATISDHLPLRATFNL